MKTIARTALLGAALGTLPSAPAVAQSRAPALPGDAPPDDAPPDDAPPDDAPPATPAEARESVDYADDQTALAFDLLSLRVGGYRVRGAGADATTTGFLVAFDPDVNVLRDHVSARVSSYAAIGGGSAGLEGQIEETITAGVRGYLGKDHGPFARLGLGFQVFGNNKIYRSTFELPVAEAGYQLFDRHTLFEVGARSGLVLGGRFNLGDEGHRRLDTGPEFGGFVTLQSGPLRAQASFARILAAQTLTGTPVDQASGSLCAAFAKVAYLCGHAAHHRGDVRVAGAEIREASALYFGGTIALGAFKNR